MQKYTIEINVTDEQVNQVATLLGFDNTGTAHDFVLAQLGPKVQDAVAEIMLAPGKAQSQKAMSDSFAANQKAIQQLNQMKPELVKEITII